MKNYINIFKENLNFVQSNVGHQVNNLFMHELENFEIFDTVKYEKMCIGFEQLIYTHTQENIFDYELLANAIHLEYGTLRTYVLEKNNMEFRHKDSLYSFEEFDQYLNTQKGFNFVDYTLFLSSYLLQQYTRRKTSNIEEYILNKELVI